MKAPDKIYLAVGDSINYIFPRFYGEPKKHPLYRDVEYIRKDALLEWAKDMVDEYERLLVGFPDNGSNWAKKRAFEELIEKLNSM